MAKKAITFWANNSLPRSENPSYTYGKENGDKTN